MADAALDKRRVARIPFEAIISPFIGSKQKDHSCFQYLIRDVSTTGVQIAALNCASNDDSFKENEIINYHIPFEFNERFYGKGTTIWLRWDGENMMQMIGSRFEQELPIPSSAYVSLDSSSISINIQGAVTPYEHTLKVVKDAIFLKKGVLLYLNQIIPYFSRFTFADPHDPSKHKMYLLSDIIKKVSENYDEFQAFYKTLVSESDADIDLKKKIDLVRLRQLVESEINVEIFTAAFTNERTFPYMNSIKQLEKRLYNNYNLIVMLYMKAI